MARNRRGQVMYELAVILFAVALILIGVMYSMNSTVSGLYNNLVTNYVQNVTPTATAVLPNPTATPLPVPTNTPVPTATPNLTPTVSHPTVALVSPLFTTTFNGSTQYEIVVNYTDTQGVSDLAYVTLLLNSNVDPNNSALYFKYDGVSRKFYLYDSDNTDLWMAMVAGGVTGKYGTLSDQSYVVTQPSGCTTNCQTLQVHYKFTPKSWTESPIYPFMFAQNNFGSNSGWVQGPVSYSVSAP